MAESPTRPRQNTLARVLAISCGQKPEAAAVPRPSRPRVSVCNTGVSSLRSAGGGAAHVITPESGRPVADLVLFCGPPDPSQPSSVFDAVLPLDLQRKIDFVESVRELGGGEAFLAVGPLWQLRWPLLMGGRLGDLPFVFRQPMAELGGDEELDSPPASWQFEHIEIVPWQGLGVAVGHLPEFSHPRPVWCIR